MKITRTIRLFAPLVIIIAIVGLGVSGFMIIEHFSLLDAIYMTIITITTIGYEEVKPLSTAGKIFNIGLIISSFATFAFALARLTEYVVNGEIKEFFKTRRLMQGIEHLQDHIIICGFGRNGQQAAKTLKHHHFPFVVIDNNEEMVNDELKKDHGLLHIKGDATNDDILLRAGIKNARALITTLPVDADNVFIVLSARGLNDHLKIISRASASSAYNKLKKAGATHVIMPDKIGGAHMAGLVSRPDVIEFIDYIGSEENIQKLGVIELHKVDKNACRLLDVLNGSTVNVVGIKLPGGGYNVNPASTSAISNGCKLFVLGKEDDINDLQAKFEK